jgi:hypothetical protein
MHGLPPRTPGVTVIHWSGFVPSMLPRPSAARQRPQQPFAPAADAQPRDAELPPPSEVGRRRHTIRTASPFAAPVGRAQRRAAVHVQPAQVRHRRRRHRLVDHRHPVGRRVHRPRGQRPPPPRPPRPGPPREAAGATPTMASPPPARPAPPAARWPPRTAAPSAGGRRPQSGSSCIAPGTGGRRPACGGARGAGGRASPHPPHQSAQMYSSPFPFPPAGWTTAMPSTPKPPTACISSRSVKVM